MAFAERPSRYGWVVLGAYTLNYSSADIALLTLGLLLPEISHELSLSPSMQGWLASSVLFGNLLFDIPINWWLSRYRPWRVAAGSFLGAAGFIMLSAWSPTFAVLLLARVGLGIVYLANQPARTLLILQWIPRYRINLANGLIFSGLEALAGVGFIFIPLILAWVGGWRETLWVWTGVASAIAVLWLILGRERASLEFQEHMKSQLTTPLSSLFKYREVWILSVGVAGAVAGRVAFTTFWPTFTQNEYATTITLAGLVIGVMPIAIAPGIWGVALVPFLSRNTPSVLAICGIGLVGCYVGLLHTGYLPFMFLLSVAAGIFSSYMPSVMTVVYRLPGIKPREVAVAVGLVFTVLWGGAALGPLTTGFIQDSTENLRLALLVTCLSPLILSAAGLALLPMWRRSEKGGQEAALEAS